MENTTGTLGNRTSVFYRTTPGRDAGQRRGWKSFGIVRIRPSGAERRVYNLKREQRITGRCARATAAADSISNAE
jgi:hypothetical protein